jgi:putative phosphoribosyl transferase
MNTKTRGVSPTPVQEVRLAAGNATLDGFLAIPGEASGIVLFAHGSGSGRNSPRNQYVARELQGSGIATLLFDLLTPREEEEEMFTRHHRFNIELLAERLAGATDWVRNEERTRALPVGYFGASTGAAAALVASTRYPEAVRAIVSRGGRPDLAGQYLRMVKAPTLLIVGGRDSQVIEMNREAYDRLEVEKDLVIVPGATHLFEEPGALEKVSVLAADWFARWLATVPAE